MALQEHPSNLKKPPATKYARELLSLSHGAPSPGREVESPHGEQHSIVTSCLESSQVWSSPPLAQMEQMTAQARAAAAAFASSRAAQALRLQPARVRPSSPSANFTELADTMAAPAKVKFGPRPPMLDGTPVRPNGRMSCDPATYNHSGRAAAELERRRMEAGGSCLMAEGADGADELMDLVDSIEQLSHSGATCEAMPLQHSSAEATERLLALVDELEDEDLAAPARTAQHNDLHAISLSRWREESYRAKSMIRAGNPLQAAAKRRAPLPIRGLGLPR